MRYAVFADDPVRYPRRWGAVRARVTLRNAALLAHIPVAIGASLPLIIAWTEESLALKGKMNHSSRSRRPVIGG